MTRVALATCAAAPDGDAENALLLGALRDRGVDAVAKPWTDAGWEAFDAVVVRQTWDYPSQPTRFVRWARAIGARLHNPPDVVEWNVDKRYLFDLERAGVAVVGGALVPPGEAVEAPAGRFVVKPTISAGARDTAVYDDDRRAAAARHVAALHAAGRTALVQPYLERVESDAETAVVFVEGELSHAMRKAPLLALDQEQATGLFRIEHMSRREPDADVLELAERALAFATERFGRLLYARADVLRDRRGAPALLELELVEPSLFLDFAPGSEHVLAAAIARRAGA